jgi:thiol-disulfide isomerase/thioredoxin
MRGFWVAIFGIIAVTLAAAGPAPAQKAEGDLLVALAGGGTGGWVNTTRPLTADDFKGRLILLDFWTYGCINCMHVIPDLDYLEKKYPEVMVIGVHSAKYTGEGLSARIRQAAERFGIHHPVMNDNDYKVWDRFGVRAWPTLVLLDDRGAEISRYAGEGHRAELERDIVRAGKQRQLKKDAPGLTASVREDGILRFPSHIQPLGQGRLLVSDTAHHQLVEIDAATGKVIRRIGSGTAGFGDGDAATAQFNMPRGFAVADGIIYVADTGNHALRAIDRTGKVTTLAGTGKRGFDRTPGGAAKGMALASPWDIEPQADGSVAIAMAGTHQLWVYDPKTGEIYVLAGNGREDIGDGRALSAELAQPSGLSRAGDILYFVDAESSSLRQLKGGRVETLIGTGLFDFGRLDGHYPTASLQHPQGVFAADGKVYVADTYNDALRVYDVASKSLSTVKLSGETLNEPGDVAVVDGHAYLADTGNSRLVRVDLSTGAAEILKVKE